MKTLKQSDFGGYSHYAYKGVNSFDSFFTDFKSHDKSNYLTTNESATFPISIKHKDGYDYGTVQLKPETLRYIANEMIFGGINANGGFVDFENLGRHFELIQQDKNNWLLVCKFDQILGSHWLSMIDSETVPKLN